MITRVRSVWPHWYRSVAELPAKQPRHLVGHAGFDRDEIGVAGDEFGVGLRDVVAGRAGDDETAVWEGHLRERLARDGSLRRHFEFEDFQAALDFVNEVGAIAEQEGHHPNISFTWGEADITVYTHKIDGLHENDFILASKIDDLLNED